MTVSPKKMHSWLGYMVVALVISLALSYAEGSLRSCKRSSDCRVGECCAVAKRKTIKFCKQNSQLGDICSLFNKPRPVLPWRCPCDVGLTCALSPTQSQTGKSPQKSTCVRVPHVEEESTQKCNVTQGNSTR